MAIDNAMQAILEAAREYGFFEHRSDIAVNDWTIADFPIVGTWYDLDLTSIVPEHAHAVLFRCNIKASAVEKTFDMRRKGYVQGKINATLYSQVANIFNRHELIVGIGPDRIVQARRNSGTITQVWLNLKGWWW